MVSLINFEVHSCEKIDMHEMAPKKTSEWPNIFQINFYGSWGVEIRPDREFLVPRLLF